MTVNVFVLHIALPGRLLRLAATTRARLAMLCLAYVRLRPQRRAVHRQPHAHDASATRPNASDETRSRRESARGRLCRGRAGRVARRHAARTRARRSRRRHELLVDLERHRAAALLGQAARDAAAALSRSFRATRPPARVSERRRATSRDVQRRRRGLRRRQHVLYRRRRGVRRAVVASDQARRAGRAAQRHPAAPRAACSRSRRPRCTACSASATSPDAASPCSGLGAVGQLAARFLTAAGAHDGARRPLRRPASGCTRRRKGRRLARFPSKSSVTSPSQHAIEATGDPAQIARCARIIEPGGSIVLLSYYDTLTTPFVDLFVKEATLLVSREWAPPRSARRARRGRVGRRRSGSARQPRRSDRTLRSTRIKRAFNDPSVLKVVLQWA